MSFPPPNKGRYDGPEYIEYTVYPPVRGSLTGAHPGLFTSENSRTATFRWNLSERN